jgi:uncharacterized membrane protein YvbJ
MEEIMSKICLYCRKEVEDTSLFCTNCGQKVDATSFASQTINSTVENQTNNMNLNQKVNSTEPKKDSNVVAIIGFTLSVISPLCCCGTSLFGLILSIIGLVESKKKNGKGKSLAIAGIIISAIFVVLLVVLSIIGASSSIVDSNLKGINTGKYY